MIRFPKKVIDIGGSKGIIIPKEKAIEEGIEIGDIVDVSVNRLKKYNEPT